MITNLGDYLADSIVYYMFNTSDKGGASATRSTQGFIRIYKNDSATQRSSQAQITDTNDFDSASDLDAGVHMVKIDLSDNTDAGFYAAGNDYFIVLDNATVDTENISAALAMFSIENRYTAKPAKTVVEGTIDTTNFAPTTTQFEADDITETTADHYVDRNVYFITGVLAGQGAKAISAYAIATGRGHFTVAALTEAPGNNDEFIIL